MDKKMGKLLLRNLTITSMTLKWGGEGRGEISNFCDNSKKRFSMEAKAVGNSSTNNSTKKKYDWSQKTVIFQTNIPTRTFRPREQPLKR